MSDTSIDHTNAIYHSLSSILKDQKEDNNKYQGITESGTFLKLFWGSGPKFKCINDETKESFKRIQNNYPQVARLLKKQGYLRTGLKARIFGYKLLTQDALDSLLVTDKGGEALSNDNALNAKIKESSTKIREKLQHTVVQSDEYTKIREKFQHTVVQSSERDYLEILKNVASTNNKDVFSQELENIKSANNALNKVLNTFLASYVSGDTAKGDVTSILETITDEQTDQNIVSVDTEKRNQLKENIYLNFSLELNTAFEGKDQARQGRLISTLKPFIDQQVNTTLRILLKEKNDLDSRKEFAKETRAALDEQTATGIRSAVEKPIKIMGWNTADFSGLFDKVAEAFPASPSTPTTSRTTSTSSTNSIKTSA